MQAIARALWAGLLLWSLPVAGADAPTVLKPALPQEPLHYDTAEGAALTVNLRTRGLAYPQSLISLPDGSALATPKNTGVIRRIVGGKLRDMPVQGMSEVAPEQHIDLLGIAPHPDFANQPHFYLSYNKPLPVGQVAAAMRGHGGDHHLVDTRHTYVADISTTSGSRMLVGLDGYLHVLTSAADDVVLRIEPAH